MYRNEVNSSLASAQRKGLITKHTTAEWAVVKTGVVNGLNTEISVFVRKDVLRTTLGWIFIQYKRAC